MAASENSDQTGAAGHRAAKRALQIIEHVAASSEPVSLSELSRQVELPKSSAHALARTLDEEGYLVRDERGGYGLGPRLLRLLGQLPHRYELPRVARPVMEELVAEVGETAILGVRQDRHVVYVEQVEAAQFIRYVAPLGEPRPLHATSIGKLFLAAMSGEDVDRLLHDIKLEKFTSHTLTSARALRSELAAIRTRGYAINDQESMADVAAIAVPVYEGPPESARLIAGLSMAGPAGRMRQELPALPERLLAAAQRIGEGVKPR